MVMKKLFIIIFSLIVFCSCTGNNSVKNKTPYNKIDKVEEFTYKGHQYIVFDFSELHTYGKTVVHDPDCWCWDVDTIYN